jgi:thymidylate kinase
MKSEFYGYFEKRFYLTAGNETIQRRLKNRIKHASKRTIDDLAIQQTWNEFSKDYAAKNGFILIDAEASPEDVADTILSKSNVIAPSPSH